MDARWLVPMGLLVAAVAASQYRGHPSNPQSFQNKNLLSLNMNTPTIWLQYDDTDVNSRFWSDFGARSSRVLNLPFMNLCYQTIVKASAPNQHVEVISGLQDAANRLGGWEELPLSMRNKRIPLRTEEMTQLKVAFLAKFGGLWMTPATICLQSFPKLPADKVVFFGSDPLETQAGVAGTALPNQHAMWAGAPNHPVMTKWRNTLYNRLEEMPGGKEIRHDREWDLNFYSSTSDSVSVMPNVELTRKKGGRKIELEDLLAAGTEGVLPFEVPNGTLWVPFPWPELLERRMFGWFLRLSEDQVLESDLAVTHLFRKAGL